MDLLAVLRHRRPGRLLRAVRRRDGRDGPRPGHPLAGGRGLPGRTTQPDGRILYTSDERHAWPEMYFTGVGWVRFEPTPSQRTGRLTGVHPAGRHRTDTDAGAQCGRHPEVVTGGGRSRRREGEEGPGVERPVVAGRRRCWCWCCSGPRRRWSARVQRRRRLSGTDPVHLAEGAWAELRATALDLGLEWPDRGTPRDQARRVVDQVPAEADEVALARGPAGAGGARSLRPPGRRGQGRPGSRPRETATLLDEERAHPSRPWSTGAGAW